MKTKLTGLFAMAALLAGGAQAQTAPAPAPEAAPAPAVATNFSLTTKYKYRGQDQANTNVFAPAVQGGFDYSNSGFYVGNWNSSISFTNAGIEMDFYAGYKGEIVEGLGYDVGVLQYYYPQKDKAVDYNTTEVYGAVSFGPASLKYSHTVSKDYFGWGAGVESGRNTGYVDLSANYEVVKGLTLNGHFGYTRFAKDLKDNVGTPNYYDYKLGATYDLGSGFSVGGAIVGANKKDFYGEINKARPILTLTKAM